VCWNGLYLIIISQVRYGKLWMGIIKITRSIFRVLQLRCDVVVLYKNLLAKRKYENPSCHLEYKVSFLQEFLLDNCCHHLIFNNCMFLQALWVRKKVQVKMVRRITSNKASYIRECMMLIEWLVFNFLNQQSHLLMYTVIMIHEMDIKTSWNWGNINPNDQ
jgi:hypothetical protein